MENVVLTVLLIIALALILVVLMQRSEGGGLGMGGGGGGGAVSGRSAANALTKLTWALGVAFMAASLVMTGLAARKASNTSVIDLAPGVTQPAAPGSDLLPPALGDGPLTPPRVD